LGSIALVKLQLMVLGFALYYFNCVTRASNLEYLGLIIIYVTLFGLNIVAKTRLIARTTQSPYFAKQHTPVVLLYKHSLICFSPTVIYVIGKSTKDRQPN